MATIDTRQLEGDALIEYVDTVLPFEQFYGVDHGNAQYSWSQRTAAGELRLWVNDNVVKVALPSGTEFAVTNPTGNQLAAFVDFALGQR